MTATSKTPNTALIVKSVQLTNNVVHLAGAGVPTNGGAGTGAGIAGPGSLYSDATGAKLYINTNTLASPTWTVVGTQV